MATATCAGSLPVERGVLLDVFPQLCTDIVCGMDRVRGAHRNASSTVDTSLGIDIQLGSFFETSFVLLGMNAVGWTNVNAEFVFDAGISDHIGHEQFSSFTSVTSQEHGSGDLDHRTDVRYGTSRRLRTIISDSFDSLQ